MNNSTASEFIESAANRVRQKEGDETSPSDENSPSEGQPAPILPGRDDGAGAIPPIVPPDYDVDDVVEYIAGRITLREIADKRGCSKQAVSQAFKKYGVQRKHAPDAAADRVRLAPAPVTPAFLLKQFHTEGFSESDVRTILISAAF